MKKKIIKKIIKKKFKSRTDKAAAKLTDTRIDLECNACTDIIYANRPTNKDTNRDVPAEI